MDTRIKPGPTHAVEAADRDPWHLSKRATDGAMLSRAHQATGRLVEHMDDAETVPDIGDLAARLRFSLREGRIWLDTQRVVLFHLATLTSLRIELIESLGRREARGFLTRMGYASGARDAVLARKLRPHHSARDAFLVGPQLRMLQGVSAMEPVRLEADVARGHYYGEFTWKDSFEVDGDLPTYGMASAPVCWMQVGYACGYTSTFLGRNVLYREVECRATGSRHCRIIGKPIEEWQGTDISEDLRALQGETMVERQAGEKRRAEVAVSRDRQAKSPAEMSRGHGMVGVSSGYLAVTNLIRKVAGTDATVLFLGETGVGKEMFARTLHRLSQRVDKPFLAVNCAAIPENLIEAELFGVEKGAFTGALQSRPGRFERADGGSLFLDEVGALTLTAQIKLLRAIQEKEFERVGDTITRKADVRIVAATNVDLKEAVKVGQFRDDLLFRLNVYPIRIPPLRERRDDIPLLMDHFLNKYAGQHGRSPSGFTERAVDALYDYDYPGNIRELENLIERAVILVEPGEPIDVGHLFAADDLLPHMILKVNPSGGLSRSRNGEAGGEAPSLLLDLVERGASLDEIEERLMRDAVDKAGGNLAEAARRLGLTRPQLAYRLKRLPKSP